MTTRVAQIGGMRQAPTLDMLVEFDFLKCVPCGRICSRTEMEAAIAPGGNGQACPCGSLKYSPFQITWAHYTLPQVIRAARLQFTDGDLRVDLWNDMTEEGFSFLARCRALVALWYAQWQVT